MHLRVKLAKTIPSQPRGGPDEVGKSEISLFTEGFASGI